MGMDEILDKVKNWPDWIISLSLAFSFDRSFLKLADKGGMDEISNEYENCPDQNTNLRVTSP